MKYARHTLASLVLGPAMAAGLIAMSATPLAAQPPRQQSPSIVQARQACDAAASRYGYQIMRRDRESVNGNAYDLPMHVSHAGAQADVTCRYDAQRGVADMPRWEDRMTAGNRNNRAEMAQNAQTMCQNFVGQQRGYQVQQVGTPTRHNKNVWDVPVTVRRNNGRRDRTVTCRYNAASNKLSLR